MQRLLSPDGQRAAMVYASYCGPTTETLVNVSLLPASEETLPRTGNIFRADSDYGAARLTKEGYPWAAVSWSGPAELLIRYADRQRVLKQETKKDGVVVRYAVEK